MNKKMSNFAVILVIVMVFFSGCYPQSKNVHFYFVQLTDTHFGDLDNIERTEKCVNSINQLPMQIECVVHTGDITMEKFEDKETISAGKSVLEKLNIPMHFLPGNHDILPEKLQPTTNAYRKQFGDLYSKAEYNGVIFLFVYTEPLVKNFKVDHIDTLKWLETSLKDAKGKPVIIFHHTPSVKDFYNNKFRDSWPSDMQAKWQKLISSYNVKAVMAGHYHRDEFHWLGDVPLYVCSPIAGYWGRQATYRIYEYNNGKIGYRTQYIE